MKRTIGLCLAGMLGVIAQEIVDYSFWVDPVFYTFALIASMVAASPVVRRDAVVSSAL